MRVFVSTADASGDLHAAGLVDALRARLSGRGERLHLFGLGGASLEAAGLLTLQKYSSIHRAYLFLALQARTIPLHKHLK